MHREVGGLPRPTFRRFALFGSTLGLCADLVFVGLVAGCGINPPRPEPQGVSTPLPVPASSIGAALSVNAAKAFALANQSVPSTFNAAWPDQWIEDPPGNRLKYRYSATRSPLQFRLVNGVLKVAADADYMACGGYDLPLAPIIVGCCGNDPPRDGPRHIAAEISVSVTPTADWRLSPLTSIDRVQGTSRCRVTKADFDVTSFAEGAVRAALQNNLAKVNDAIRNIDIRTPATYVWSEMQKPIRITDSTWLVVNPNGVALGPLTGTGQIAVVKLAVTAKPQIVYGQQPTTTATPLPSLSVGGAQDGFFVVLEGITTVEQASKVMQDALVGKRLYRGSKYIEVKNARVYGTGSNVAVAEIGFDGDAKGRMYFVGSPIYNAATGQLLIPDLDFDLATKNVLLKSADWLYHTDVRDFFRASARWTMTQAFDQAKQSVNSALKTSPAKGIRLDGQVTTLQGSSVAVTTTDVIVRVLAQGSLTVFADPF